MSIFMTRMIAALAIPLAVAPSLWRGRLGALRMRRRRTATLDLEHAPEAQLRDLGIIDGRGLTPAPEDTRNG